MNLSEPSSWMQTERLPVEHDARIPPSVVRRIKEHATMVETLHKLDEVLRQARTFNGRDWVYSSVEGRAAHAVVLQTLSDVVW